MTWSLFLIVLFVLLRNVLVQRKIPPGLVENENAAVFEVYSLKETFIGDCPYRNPKFELSTGPLTEKNFWLAKKHPKYGFFEDRNNWNVLLTDDLPIINPDGITECLYKTDNSYVLSSCDAKGVYELCVYHPENEDFCLSYEAICKSKCYGKSKYKSQFSCGAIYDESASCEKCDEEFEKYPKPSINMRRRGPFGLAVIISNRGKVVKQDDGSIDLRCIDGMSTTSNGIWNELMAQEDQALIENDVETIWITPYSYGFYSCEIITYPDLTVIRSEEVMRTEQTNFVINVTSTDPNGIPFKAHSTEWNDITLLLSTYVNNGLKIKLLVLYPQSSDMGSMILAFHSHGPTRSTVEEGYNILRGELGQKYTVKSCEFCMEEQIIVGENTLTWPTSRLGEVVPSKELVLMENGLPVIRSCDGTFKQGASWSQFNIPKIINPEDITKNLYDLLTNTNLTANEINVQLLEIINSTTDVIPYDVYLIANCLQRITESEEWYDAQVAINTIDHVMDIDRSILHSSQINLMATDTILRCYDKILESQKNIKYPIVVQGEKTIAQIVHINGKTNGIAVYQTQNGISVTPLSIHEETEIEKTDLVVASYLPRKVLHEIEKFISNYNETFLVTSIFLNNKLFNDEHKFEWQVMNVFISNVSDTYFLSGLPVVFGERYKNIDSNQSCGYWKYGLTGDLATIFGRWEDDGKMIISKNYKVCYFNHMTHFALIFNAPENRGVNIVTAIVTSISIISILFIFLTAICFEKWRREEGVKILLNYSAAILLQDVLILIFDLVDVKNVFCTIYGVLLHFSIIAQFTWMLFINYVQYRKFVQVFQSPLNNNPAKFILLTWILPLIPIIVVLAINVNSYQNDDYCFIRDLNLYLSLFLPISLTVIVNIILFVKIALSIFKNNTNAIGTSLLKYKINICVLLFFLSGFTWTFGLLANAFQSIILSYLFCTMAIGQGLLLWIYFVLTKKDVRRFWMGKLRTKLLAMGQMNIPRPTLSTVRKSTESFTNSHN